MDLIGKLTRREQPATGSWPDLNEELRHEITSASDAPGLVDIWELSPLRFDDNDNHSAQIIATIFSDPETLICAGPDQHRFATKKRREWKQWHKLRFICPSPMVARRGRTQSGKVSAHALSIVGPRRYLVVEFDHGSADDHAALLLHLAQYAPLTLVVHSGNKSVHGWYYCFGQPEELLLRFFRYAVSLGADPMTWVPSQFVRVPDGRHSNGRRQTTYYFDPVTIER